MTIWHPFLTGNAPYFSPISINGLSFHTLTLITPFLSPITSPSMWRLFLTGNAPYSSPISKKVFPSIRWLLSPIFFPPRTLPSIHWSSQTTPTPLQPLFTQTPLHNQPFHTNPYPLYNPTITPLTRLPLYNHPFI